MAKSREKKFTFTAGDACPCGSGRTIAGCSHYDLIGNCFRKPVRPLRPPPPPTGYSHPKCYLRGTQDCSEQISAEHYISASVLVQLGKVIRFSGAPWLAEGKPLETTIGSFTAKILCRRHNEALAALDTEAGIFFQALDNVLVDLGRRTLSRKPRFELASGEAIELWMLKLACGLYFAGSVGGRKVSEENDIDFGKVERAFFERKWDHRGGLYVQAAPGDLTDIQNSVRAAPLINPERKQMAGAFANLRGLKLELVFDTVGMSPDTWLGRVKAPGELTWRKGPRQHSIILTWPRGTPEKRIVLNAKR